LNENGIYRFQQIADWNDYNVWSFNRIISFPGRIQRDEWIRQAKELAPGSRCLNPGSAKVSADELNDIVSLKFAGEDVVIREPFGIVYQSPPTERDNLQEIKGVGPVLEQKLHEFGVYKFKQIANWPDAAIDEFQEQLSFPDRIRRDDWVGQCEKFIVSN
jgi:predicted flap endonuclease-1-like 5' DNA nuclease